MKEKRRKIIAVMSSKSKAVVSNGDDDLMDPPKASKTSLSCKLFDVFDAPQTIIIALAITSWIWSALGLSIHI